jgi:hypothetical protein
MRLHKRVGREGLEPSRPFGQEILSLQRLPFRHRPIEYLLCHDTIIFPHIRQ